MSDFCETFDYEKALEFAKMVLIDDDNDENRCFNGPPGFTEYSEKMETFKDNDLFDAVFFFGLYNHDGMRYFSPIYTGNQESKCKIPCLADAIRRTGGKFQLYFDDFELLEKEKEFLKSFDSYKFRIHNFCIEDEEEWAIARLMRIETEREGVEQTFCFALVASPIALREYTNPTNGETSTFKQLTYSLVNIQEN